MDAERCSRSVGLGAPAIDQRLALGEIVGHLAVLAVGGDHHDHAVPLGAARASVPPVLIALVVGVCVEADQCSHEIPFGAVACAESPRDDGTAGDQCLNCGGVEAPVAQDFCGVLARVRGRPGDLGGRAREPRRRRRLR